MDKLHFAICDDNDFQLVLFRDMLEEYFSANNIHGTITTFTSGKDLVEAVKQNGQYSVIFLDMIMPEIDGIQTAKSLRANGCKMPIIFVTSSTDFLLESYEIHAFHYLLKPVSLEKLTEVLDELFSSISDDETIIQLHTKNGDKRVPIDGINTVERQDKTIIYRLSGGDTLVSTLRGSFKSATEELVSQGSFAEAGVSMLINLKRISGVDRKNGEISMDDGSIVYPPASTVSQIFSVWSSL